MALISVVRICAFLTMVLLSRFHNEMELYNVVIFTGLAHYFLSVVYARRNLISIATRPVQAVSFLGVIGASIWLYVSSFSLACLFLPHHVFNEVYLSKKELYPMARPEIKALTAAGIVLHTLLYTQILGIWNIIGCYWCEDYIAPSLAVATGIFAICLWRAHKIIGWRRTMDACVFEVIVFITLFLTQYTTINFFQIVLYHFIFWAAYPLTTLLAQKNKPEATKYVLANIGVMLVVALTAPFSPLPWRFTGADWSQLFLIGSFLHIMSSFAVSRAQPDWIWKFFLPPPRSVPIAVATNAQTPLLETAGSR